MLCIVCHEGHHGVHALFGGLSFCEIFIVIAGDSRVNHGDGDFVVICLQLLSRICIGLRIKAELLTKLRDLILYLIKSRQRILCVTAHHTRVGEVVYKLLILLFKLLKSNLGILGAIVVAVIQSVQLVNGLLNGVLQTDEHIVDLFVYECEVTLGAFNVRYLLGNVYSLVAQQVNGVINGAV